ncbi:MAG TPA: HD domain-containing protein [Chloroflexota bacterium]
MTREEAWALLTEWTTTDHLIKHSLAVEAALRAYARRLGEDEEKWALAGLLHDFDYERHQTLDRHPKEGAPVLRQRGVPDDVVYAILSHGLDAEAPPRRSALDRALFAVDELTGFITAVALVRPNRDLNEVEVSSVRKKMKDKAFARAVSREDVVQGAELMGVTLDEHIGVVLVAMRGIAPRLGLTSG